MIYCIRYQCFWVILTRWLSVQIKNLFFFFYHHKQFLKWPKPNRKKKHRGTDKNARPESTKQKTQYWENETTKFIHLKLTFIKQPQPEVLNQDEPTNKIPLKTDRLCMIEQQWYPTLPLPAPHPKQKNLPWTVCSEKENIFLYHSWQSCYRNLTLLLYRDH